jgi:hypothetical protein
MAASNYALQTPMPPSITLQQALPYEMEIDSPLNLEPASNDILFNNLSKLINELILSVPPEGALLNYPDVVSTLTAAIVNLNANATHDWAFTINGAPNANIRGGHVADLAREKSKIWVLGELLQKTERYDLKLKSLYGQVVSWHATYAARNLG